jgi:hypothetical protein
MKQEAIKQYSKETADFVVELLKAPIKTAEKKHDLNWAQILIYFTTVSVIANIILAILWGVYRHALLYPIEIALSQVIYLGIALWISTMVLQNNEIQIEERELAQVWIKGGILGSTFSLALGGLRMLSPHTGSLLVGLVPMVLIAGFTYLYLHKTKSVEKEKARNMSLIIGVIVGIFPFGSYSGMYWLF